MRRRYGSRLSPSLGLVAVSDGWLAHLAYQKMGWLKSSFAPTACVDTPRQQFWKMPVSCAPLDAPHRMKIKDRRLRHHETLDINRV